MKRSLNKALLGIDCDTKKIAITRFENGTLKSWGLLTSQHKVAQDRTFELYGLFENYLKNNKGIDRVMIEESLFANNFWTSKTLTEVISFCKLLCHLNNITFEIVYNTTWKKEIVGSGKASKKDIADWVLKKYPQLKGEKQDILDSVCIGLYGVKKYGY